jgi:hypothetical protein
VEEIAIKRSLKGDAPDKAVAAFRERRPSLAEVCGGPPTPDEIGAVAKAHAT